MNPSDPIAAAAPVQWAAQELEQALADAGVTVHRVERPEQAPAGEFCVVVSGSRAPLAAAALKSARVSVPDGPESLALVAARPAGRQALPASGSDARGLVYALLEVADRVRHSPPPEPLRYDKPMVERPANAVRSAMRSFTCEALDKPWFYDREMWPRYLTMLANARSNPRLSLRQTPASGARPDQPRRDRSVCTAQGREKHRGMDAFRAGKSPRNNSAGSKSS